MKKKTLFLVNTVYLCDYNSFLYRLFVIKYKVMKDHLVNACASPQTRLNFLMYWETAFTADRQHFLMPDGSIRDKTGE
jgi:hypothetical protein